jgi:hypothetical protein
MNQERELKTFVQQNNNMNAKKLQTLTKNDLIEKCKELNLNCYGTKFDMVQRIMGSQKKGIITDIKHTIPPIKIEKDPETGSYIHFPTSLVFDPLDKRVIARKENDGKLRSLRYEDIKICLKYKFRYLLPENLAAEENDTLSGDTVSSDEERSKSSNRSKNVDTFCQDTILEKRLLEIENDTRQDAHVDDDDEEDEEEDEEVL